MSNISPTIFSPKTFLNKKLYDSLPALKRLRHKVSQDSFYIPDYNQYDNIIQLNYNVSQLKKMCKYYNQKQSGNKNELMKRMYNYLKYSHYAIIIQKNVRRNIVMRYIKSHGPALLDKKICVNDTDFLTMDDVKDIPHYQFFSYTDKDNFTYGFDICSLYNLYQNSRKDTKNPYNRKPFPKELISKLRRLIGLCRVMRYPVNIEIKEDIPVMTQEQEIVESVHSVFQTIDQLGNYTDAQWFLSLNKVRLIRYIRELFDIWSYRAQLSSEVKRNICPPNGNPFYNNQLPYIHNRSEWEVRKFVINIVRKMVTSGIDDASKNLGAYYCLAALTLVNNDAAEALPWLYQSVSHNT